MLPMNTATNPARTFDALLTSRDPSDCARLACQTMPSDTYEERTAQLDARAVLEDAIAISASIDAAAATATANLVAAVSRVTALKTVLRLMSDMDDVSADPALTDEERNMIDRWIPGSAFKIVLSKLAEAEAAILALENAVCVACDAVNVDAPVVK